MRTVVDKIILKGENIMPTKKLKHFLDANGIRYITLTHSPAYTCQEIAARAHISGKELAKSVMVKIDGKMAMVVLPASHRVDFELLKDVTGANYLSLATETEFRNFFPECEPGAMPPFGNLYGMDVYVADILSDDEEIAFNAGSHTELIRMAYSDFERLVRPRIVHIAAMR
jgi:Ala-tRNA(Pro) deacylase